MKRCTGVILIFLAVCCLAITGGGCSGETKQITKQITGNWTRFKNHNYILLIIKTNGTWDSSVRMTDATSRIVKSKGSADGTWHVEGSSIIFSVANSDIDTVWKPGEIVFYEILQLEDELLELKDDQGNTTTWKRNRPSKQTLTPEDENRILSMKPVTVNLNKNRSADKDRYLCLNMALRLKELVPGTPVPAIHPRARDAAIVYLSSLVFEDVRDFDRVKAQKKKLISIMNPYMDDMIKDIEIDHVLIASSMTKVEEFIIEHTLSMVQPDGEGETGDNGRMETQEE